MRLKNLTLYGFKSFPEKTTFDFEPGITGIVGPNGCGKSNVVDAVRWTLGEQSAKKLRGQEMTDVIFNGSANRKPLGYCEVSLTFDNNRNLLPVEYSEVCITRRLYRTGESEYMINKQPSRLKDIKELFMDTGIGMDAYSSIEQGKVDLLLNANSQERRSVFEEAAGISRYKAKRKECMAKLERTEANLLRAADVVRELESRVRSLHRQAGKAGRYKAFQDEMRELRVKFSEHKFSELSRGLEKERARIEEVTGRLTELTSARSEIEQEVAKKENQRLNLDDQLSEIQGKLTVLQGTIEASQERVQAEERRIEELDVEKRKLFSEEDGLSTRVEQLKTNIADTAEQLYVNKRKFSSLQGEIESKTCELEEMTRYEERLSFAVEEKKTTVADLLLERAKRGNRLGALSSEKQLLEDHRSRLLSRVEMFRQTIGEMDERRREVALQRIEKRDGAATVENELARLHGCIASLGQEIADIGRVNSDLERKKASLESRRELLAGLDARGEGLSNGVRLLLSHDGMQFDLLADNVRVEMEHVAAVEASLGERSQTLIAQTSADVKEGIDVLNGNGRAIFISLDLVSETCGLDNSIPEGLKKISSLVQCDSRFRPVVEHLLGNTYLVRSIEEAIALGRETKGRFVTSDGSLVDGALVSAGRTGGEEGGIIWRRSQMEELADEIERVSSEHIQQNSRLQGLQSEDDELQRQLFRYEETLEDLTKEIKAFEHDIAHQLKERNRIKKEIAACGDEISSLDTQLRTVNSEVTALQVEIEGIDREKEKTEKETHLLGDKLEIVSKNRKDLEVVLSSLKIEAAQTEEVERRLNESRAGSERELSEKEEALIECRSDRERCVVRRREAEEEVARSRDLLEKSSAEKANIDGKAQGIQGARREICKEIEAASSRRNDLDEQVRGKEADLQELRIKENEITVRMDNLRENVHGEYNIELTQKDLEEEVDWESVESRIQEIKNKMDSMGNVNLGALDELAELEQRAGFLKSQHDDLVSAKANLQKVIQKINKTSREQFQSTFDAIRANFQDMFRKMFGGGKADVFLEEGEDILEAGIEIIARPPGKELSSLSLLSGGEKALTAVALLFAIFKAKPSPFCILDEVDAPLDENNVGRFVNVLSEFLEHSQFLLITHNKKSMSITDCLYGVTMQEPGVSKKISVKLKEAVEMAEQN